MKPSSMNAKELNEAFLTAAEQSHHTFDDDQTELVNGRFINVAQLHKKGAAAVIKYWRDPETIGGNLINNYGYSELLSQEITELMDSIDKLIDAAINEALS